MGCESRWAEGGERLWDRQKIPVRIPSAALERFFFGLEAFGSTPPRVVAS